MVDIYTDPNFFPISSPRRIVWRMMTSLRGPSPPIKIRRVSTSFCTGTCSFALATCLSMELNCGRYRPSKGSWPTKVSWTLNETAGAKKGSRSHLSMELERGGNQKAEPQTDVRGARAAYFLPSWARRRCGSFESSRSSWRGDEV